MIFHTIECLLKAKESLDAENPCEFDPNGYTKIKVDKLKVPYIIINSKEMSPNPNHFPPNLYTTCGEKAFYQFLPMKETQINNVESDFKTNHYIDFQCEDGEPVIKINKDAQRDCGDFKGKTFSSIRKKGYVFFSQHSPYKCSQPYMSMKYDKQLIAVFYLPKVDEENEKYLENARNQAIAYLKYSKIRVVIVALGAIVNEDTFISVNTSLNKQYPTLFSLSEAEDAMVKQFLYSTNEEIDLSKKIKNSHYYKLSELLKTESETNDEPDDNLKFFIPKCILTKNTPEYPDFSTPISATFSHCIYYQKIYSKLDCFLAKEKTIASLELGYSTSFMNISTKLYKSLYLTQKPGAVTFDLHTNYATIAFYSRDYSSPMANANAIVAAFRSSRIITIAIRPSLISHLVSSFDCAIKNWKKFSLVDSFYHGSGVNLLLYFDSCDENDQSDVQESVRLMTLYFYHHNFFNSVKLHYATSIEMMIKKFNDIKDKDERKIDKENIKHSIAAFATTNKFAEYLDLVD